MLKFGKYKGWPLSEVPTDYLTWLARESRSTAHEVEQELELRGIPVAPAAPSDMLTQIVTAGYRALAQHLHPDRGGDLHQMQALNAAVAHLREVLRGLALRERRGREG